MTTATLDRPPLSDHQSAPFAPAQKSLLGLSREQLRALAQELGSPAFRGEQLHHWLYVHCERDLDKMTNLSKDFRRALVEAGYTVGQLTIDQRQQSKDGTVKYLFRLADGQVVESVLMHFEERDSYAICLSTQVGCAMACTFCATGKLGLIRHLTTAEIVEQYVYVQQDSGKELRNVVLMGQGEPLHNYDATIAAIRILNESAEVGMRRITLSTSGKVPDIQRLAQEKLPITLAVSLHAPDNETRDQIMPINKRWPVETLIASLHDYVNATHRRLTIEYILLAGVNDSLRQADQLVELLKGLKANINLIPYNPISHDLPNVIAYKRPSRDRVRAFAMRLGASGKKVTVRLERGTDIDAACGQLANRHHDDRPVEV